MNCSVTATNAALGKLRAVQFFKRRAGYALSSDFLAQVEERWATVRSTAGSEEQLEEYLLHAQGDVISQTTPSKGGGLMSRTISKMVAVNDLDL